MRRVYIAFILIFCTFKVCGRDFVGYSDRIDETSLTKDERDKPNASNNERNPMSPESFVGTNLFGCEEIPKTCFSNVDVALISVRSAFELLIPKRLPKTLLDDELIKTIMQYFYEANQVIMQSADSNSRYQAQKAFYDTLGGYLNSYLIPVAKYSYYAGLISLKTTINVYELFKQCTIFLNTNGNGWKPPSVDFSEFELSVDALHIFVKQDGEEKSCIHLELSDAHSGNEDDMIVSLPKLEPTENGLLSNIWLPFKRKRSFNLKSKFSAYILLKYFETVTRCYHFQGVCQDTFNRKLKGWLQENIEIHLGDNILYPGLGAVLRMLETVRSNKKFIVESTDSDSALVSKRTSNKEMNLKRTSPEFLEIEKNTNKLSQLENPSEFFDDVHPKNHDELSSENEENNDDEEEIYALCVEKRKHIIGIGILLLLILIFCCLKKPDFKTLFKRTTQKSTTVESIETSDTSCDFKPLPGCFKNRLKKRKQLRKDSKSKTKTTKPKPTSKSKSKSPEKSPEKSPTKSPSPFARFKFFKSQEKPDPIPVPEKKKFSKKKKVTQSPTKKSKSKSPSKQSNAEPAPKSTSPFGKFGGRFKTKEQPVESDNPSQSKNKKDRKSPTKKSKSKSPTKQTPAEPAPKSTSPFGRFGSRFKTKEQPVEHDNPSHSKNKKDRKSPTKKTKNKAKSKSPSPRKV